MIVYATYLAAIVKAFQKGESKTLYRKTVIKLEEIRDIRNILEDAHI